MPVATPNSISTLFSELNMSKTPLNVWRLMHGDVKWSSDAALNQ